MAKKFIFEKIKIKKKKNLAYVFSRTERFLSYGVKEANSNFIIRSINDLGLQRLRDTTNSNLKMGSIALISLPAKNSKTNQIIICLQRIIKLMGGAC